MNRRELNRQYTYYLDAIAEIENTRYSLKYTHYNGLLHGLGIALGYDYETVEMDIARAIMPEQIPGQLRLAI